MFIKCAKPKNFDVKSQQDRDWPWSSGPRSFQDRCTQWGPSPVLEPGSTGSATCCAHSWCAPRMTRSCCQTCLSPALQQSRKSCNYYNNIIRTCNTASHHTRFPFTSFINEWNLPQMKQVVFRTSSLPCFSLLRSANVSMITPKMRFRTIMITMKKNSRS